MPTPLSDCAVQLGEVSLSREECFRGFHRHRRLVPMLRELAIEALVLRQAFAAGLSVSEKELQKAADDFRRRNQLFSAERSRQWLAEQRLSVDDFEAGLERDLLLEKFIDHTSRDCIAGRFTARQQDYARVWLQQLVVAREDVACELLSQIREEGRSLGELAREHSLDASRSVDGRLGMVLRCQLSPQVGDAVFSSREGDVVGPLATPSGFSLFLVEALRPAELDAATCSFIRGELFDEWLNRQLEERPLVIPLLDGK